MASEVGDTIKEIKLTKEGKSPVKSIDFVSGEDRVKALHDPVRLQILRILREGIDDTVSTEMVDGKALVLTITKQQVKRHALSITELIRLSGESNGNENLTKNQIYHHIPILIEYGFITEYGTVTTGKRTTKYYRRVADNIVTFGLHYGPKKFRSALRKEIKDALPVFRIQTANEKKDELLDLLVESEVMRLKWANVIESIVQGDVTNPKAIELFEWFLWVYATGQNEFMQSLDKLRHALFDQVM
jgi:DNA-binding transcriptional ArsR family regulator